ncbi:hypothetical protein [Variovorax paradoxus]|nr:hypothetical protein [Variovorax paradoxus]
MYSSNAPGAANRGRLAVPSKGLTFHACKGARMAGQQQNSSRGDTSLEQTLEKTEAVAADVQRASDNLAVVNTVLEQGLPEEVQVGDVAQAIEHTSQLEEKLAKSAETLAEVNAALSEEIEKRLEATAERDESQARAEELKARIRTGAAD